MCNLQFPFGTPAEQVIVGCRAAVASCIVIGIGSWEFCKYQKRQHLEMVKKTIDDMNRPQGGAVPGAKPTKAGVSVNPGA
jgi:hypothetical protein